MTDDLKAITMENIKAGLIFDDSNELAVRENTFRKHELPEIVDEVYNYSSYGFEELKAVVVGVVVKWLSLTMDWKPFAEVSRRHCEFSADVIERYFEGSVDPGRMRWGVPKAPGEFLGVKGVPEQMAGFPGKPNLNSRPRNFTGLERMKKEVLDLASVFVCPDANCGRSYVCPLHVATVVCIMGCRKSFRIR